jgi:hypothetical protein
MSEQVQESTLIGLSERLESELRLICEGGRRAPLNRKACDGHHARGRRQLFRLVGYSWRDDDSPIPHAPLQPIVDRHDCFSSSGRSFDYFGSKQFRTPGHLGVADSGCGYGRGLELVRNSLSQLLEANGSRRFLGCKRANGGDLAALSALRH